jgi:hypothetical protein
MTFPTAAAALDRLCELGITAEVTGRRRNRIYVYRKYLNLLDEGTEPI